MIVAAIVISNFPASTNISVPLSAGISAVIVWKIKSYPITPCPIVLGIDEHSFSRKLGFSTRLCDLRKHKIFDIVKGRSEPDLAAYLSSLTGTERVKVVCMDLSTTYRSIVKKHFPNARIVGDRFHVFRLMQHPCMMTYRELSSDIKNNRGILALPRTRPDNLTVEKKIKRDKFLN